MHDIRSLDKTRIGMPITLYPATDWLAGKNMLLLIQSTIDQVR